MAFLSCVERSNCTPEYKLLRAHDSSEGEPLTIIQHFGFSPTAYQVAMNRLEHKYGGKKHQIMLRMEELQNFKTGRDGSSHDLEKLSSLMDCLVVNLTEAGQYCELGGGALCMTFQRKVRENLLAKYYRWPHENQAVEIVVGLQTFIDQEAEFRMTVSEIIQGLAAPKNHKNMSSQKYERKSKVTTFVTSEAPKPKQNTTFQCKVCQQPHGLWSCDKFHQMSGASC